MWEWWRRGEGEGEGEGGREGMEQQSEIWQQNEREHDASLGVGPSLSPEILPYRLCKHGPV